MSQYVPTPGGYASPIDPAPVLVVYTPVSVSIWASAPRVHLPKLFGKSAGVHGSKLLGGSNQHGGSEQSVLLFRSTVRVPAGSVAVSDIVPTSAPLISSASTVTVTSPVSLLCRSTTKLDAPSLICGASVKSYISVVPSMS